MGKLEFVPTQIGERMNISCAATRARLTSHEFSDWSNADAPCRESKKGHQCGGRYGSRYGRRWATAGHAARRGGLGCRFGAVHGEERTPNILDMSVTLEVSKLSGWLNASANCRESKGGHSVRGEVRLWSREAVGDRGARSAQERGLGCRFGAVHGEERTVNIPDMSVTLKVSKLSGSSNSVRCKRVSFPGA